MKILSDPRSDDPICIIASPQESELERARQNLGESSVKPLECGLMLNW